MSEMGGGNYVMLYIIYALTHKIYRVFPEIFFSE